MGMKQRLTVAAILAVLTTVAISARIHDEENAPSIGCSASETETNSAQGVAINYIGNSASAINFDIPQESPPYSTKNLHGMALSRPCCVSWGHARVDCFFRGATSSVMHKTVKKTETCCSCTDWEDLGNTVIGDIACISKDEGFIDILGISTGMMMTYRSYAAGGWGPWTNNRQYYIDVSGCAASSTSSIVCGTRRYDNYVFVVASNAGKWGGAGSLGYYSESPISCCSPVAGRVDCFVIYFNSYLVVRTLIGTKWSAWSNVAGSILPHKPTTTCGGNRIHVFVLGMKNDIIHIQWDGSWKTGVSLGGRFESPPECLLISDGKILCLAVGPKSDLFKNLFDGTQWSGWINLFGRFMTERPSCVLSNKRIISCYLRNVYNEIIELEFEM